MEQSSSWKANSRSTSHEITSLLRNPKIHQLFQERPPLDSILNDVNLVCSLTNSFSKIHQFFPPTYAYLFPSGFPTKILHEFLISSRTLHVPPTSSFLIWSS
jgi:hypothetical protein